MISTNRLDQVCEIIMGQAPDGEGYNNDGIGWPLIAGAGDFKEGKLTAKKYTKEASKLSRSGDIILSIRASIGDKVLSDGEYCLGRGVAGLRASSKIDSRFLWHWLSHIEPTLAAKGKGATFKQVNRGDIGELEIKYPILSEQKRIADILDKAEALRAKRREAIALINSLTQSIFLEMFGNPIENQMDWQAATVGDATECIVPGRDKPKSFSGDIPWVTTNDLNHLASTFKSSKNIGLSNAEITEVRAKVIPRGSVIMSCVGDLGILSIAGKEMVINQQLHSFQCSEALNNIFLMYCLSFQKAFMYAKASSTTLPYMNKSVCNSIPIILPPKELQEKFADKAKAVANMMSVESIFFEQADILFSSIQKMAFSGDL